MSATLGVIGAGVMGSGIAQCLARDVRSDEGIAVTVTADPAAGLQKRGDPGRSQRRIQL